MDLSTARIFVRDLARAREFYGVTLGLRLRAGGGSSAYSVFEAGRCELVVEPVAADAPPEDQVLVGRFTGLSFRVPSVHVTHQDLVAKGVRFTSPPERQFWGGVLATFSDPDGNELQIVQRDPP